MAEAKRRGIVIDGRSELIAEAQRRGISVNEQITPEERQQRIAGLEAERSALEQPGLLQVAGQAAAGTLSDLRGLPETALQMATGGAVTVAGGLAAIPVTAFDAITGGDDPAGAGRAVIEQFQTSTFEPRTEAGQRASEAIAKPLEAVEQFADTAGEVTGDADDVLGATLVKTAILAAPAVFGVRRGGTTRRTAEQPTPRQQVAADAATEGYVTPPSVRGESGAAGLAEGIGGKIKTGQAAIETNQAVTNKLASRAVGLPDDVPVTIDVLQGIRAQAGQAYEAVRGIGQVFTDTAFRRDLSAAVARFRSAAKDFPDLAKSKIINIVDGLRVSKFDAAAGIDAISLLRNRADVAFRSGDKSLGSSYRAAADAVEGVIDRHIGRGGDSGLIDGFRQARQQIAETYSVQEALQGRITGEVSATQLAAQLKRGKPLTGELRQIADFSNTFPSVSRLFTGTAQALSPIDLGVAAISGTGALVGASLGGGPAAVLPAIAAGVARPILRRAALSDVARRSGLSTDSVGLSTGAKAGATTSSALSRVGEDQ